MSIQSKREMKSGTLQKLKADSRKNRTGTGFWEPAKRMQPAQNKRTELIWLTARLSRPQLMHLLRQTLRSLIHNKMDGPEQNCTVKKVSQEKRQHKISTREVRIYFVFTPNIEDF
jgi:hypothetical protein